MTTMEARYLVDAYDLMQDDRKRAHNQVRALEEEAARRCAVGSPTRVTPWRGQIMRSLDLYTTATRGGVVESAVRHRPGDRRRVARPLRHREGPYRRPHLALRRPRPHAQVGEGQEAAVERRSEDAVLEAGPAFRKFSNSEDCYYGTVYRERKAKYVARNEAGDYASDRPRS